MSSASDSQVPRWPDNVPASPRERYRMVYTVAYRTGFSVLKDHASAEDLAHEVWLSTERHLQRLLDEPDRAPLRDFDAWLHRVALNRAIKVYQSKWRRVLREADPEPEAALERTGEPARRPDEIAALRQFGARALDAVARLSEPLGRTFMLYCEGYTHREISELLDTPIGTIKVRVHRARARLSKMLQSGTTDPGVPR